MTEIVLWLALVVTGTALTTDIPRNKIYNWLTFPLLILAPIFRFYCYGGSGLASSFFGVLAVAGLISLLFAFIGRGLGGGDIKLLLGLGALLGWPLAGSLLLYTALTSPLLAAPVMLRHRIFNASYRNLIENLILRGSGERNVSVVEGTRGPKLPFALNIMFGLLVLVIWGPLKLG